MDNDGFVRFTVSKLSWLCVCLFVYRHWLSSYVGIVVVVVDDVNSEWDAFQVPSRRRKSKRKKKRETKNKIKLKSSLQR